VRINDTGRNYRLVEVDAPPDLARAEQLIAARDRVMLDDFDVFAEDLVVTERVAATCSCA
jgi:protease II